MTGIIKDTVLESGATSAFIKILDIRFDIQTKNINFILGYYLNESACEQGLKPLEQKDFQLDNGFVKQYEDSRQIDLEIVVYNLLNTAISGVVNNS